MDACCRGETMQSLMIGHPEAERAQFPAGEPSRLHSRRLPSGLNPSLRSPSCTLIHGVTSPARSTSPHPPSSPHSKPCPEDAAGSSRPSKRCRGGSHLPARRWAQPRRLRPAAAAAAAACSPAPAPGTGPCAPGLPRGEVLWRCRDRHAAQGAGEPQTAAGAAEAGGCWMPPHGGCRALLRREPSTAAVPPLCALRGHANDPHWLTCCSLWPHAVIRAAAAGAAGAGAAGGGAGAVRDAARRGAP